jgi:hypothetical protein
VHEIDDYNYILSSIGNAYFSGITFDQLWSCINISESREDLDAAIAATIRLTEIMERTG